MAVPAAVAYRGQPPVGGGDPAAGLRAPRRGPAARRGRHCAAGGRVRLHALLARPGVHVLLHRDADRLEHLAPGRFVTVHRLTSTPGRGVAAVRPDGYVGFRCRTAETAQLAPGSPASAQPGGPAPDLGPGGQGRWLLAWRIRPS